MGSSLCCVENRKDEKVEVKEKEKEEEVQVGNSTNKKGQNKKISNLLIDMNNFYKFREGDFSTLYKIIKEKKPLDFVGEFQNDASEMQELGVLYREVAHRESGNTFTMQAFDINSSA